MFNKKNNCIIQEENLRSILSIILAGILSFSVLACAPSINKNNASITTVGILNEFPDRPNYIKKRTFVFRHQRSGFEENRFKDVLTRSASEFLVSKKYKVIEVDDMTALKDGRADLIIQIQPLDISKQEDTLGYGFYDRKFLEVLVKFPARSYICMNVNLHQKGKAAIKRTGRQESFRKLPFERMPDTQNQLTDDQKKEMSQNLEKNIRDTVFKVLPMLGF